MGEGPWIGGLPSGASNVGVVIASLLLSHSHSLIGLAPRLCSSGLSSLLYRVTEDWGVAQHLRSCSLGRAADLQVSSYLCIPSEQPELALQAWKKMSEVPVVTYVGLCCGILLTLWNHWRNWPWKEAIFFLEVGREGMVAVFRYSKACSYIVDKVPHFGLEFWACHLTINSFFFFSFFHLYSFQPKIIPWFNKCNRWWLYWLDLDSWGRLNDSILVFWTQPQVNWNCNSRIYYIQNWMSY